MCNIGVLLIARPVRGRFPQIRDLSGRVWANAWDVFCRNTPRSGRGRRAAVDFVVFWVRRDFVGGGGRFFFLNAYALLQV